MQQKRSDFWKTRLAMEQSQPHRLWRSFDALLGRRRAPLSSDVDTDTLHRYFDDKVAGVRASTDGADSPTFTPASVGCELRLFTPVSSTEVMELVRRLPDKQCMSNSLHGYWNSPLKFWLRSCTECSAGPWRMASSCWSSSHHAVTEESRSRSGRTHHSGRSLICPSSRSYWNDWSASSFWDTSRIIICFLTFSWRRERITRLRQPFSVLLDVLSALDSGNLMMLTLLDLSAAFDCVDHHTLLQRLPRHTALARRSSSTGSRRTSATKQNKCSHSDIRLNTIGSRLWSPARFGPQTDLVSAVHWRRSILVRTLVSDGELSLSCARLLAGWVTTLWLSRPLSVTQPSIPQGSINE